MKLTAKPISSPGRVDKFPPPLLRFLRNNGSSRSRGRSRSSPIFVKHRGNRASLAQEPEPSSPKVTCMGQVRVRRSKKKKKERGSKPRIRCRWIPNTLLCRRFEFDPTRWGRWGLPFCNRKAGREIKTQEEVEEDEVTVEDEFESECGLEEGEEGESFVFSERAATPPKNALLLMRCRSEPHRGSLKFWDSPLASQEEAEQKHDDREEKPIGDSTVGESRNDSKIDEGETSKVPANALLLTRCKSEPARRRDQIQVESCFWKRRLGFVDVSSTRF